MSVELTNEEKASIVQQHLKSLEFSIYNLNLSLIELNAMTMPNQQDIDNITLQLSDVESKKAALQTELNSLSVE